MKLDMSFYQHYWWFLISLLGGLLVFLLFIQGGQSLLFSLGKKKDHRSMLVFSLSQKWEFTFTTLVTFGGAAFASFPLFYSTSFGGAYWLWMLILFSFILQAVSYEFLAKKGNLLGQRTYEVFLFCNGLFGTVLLGVAVSTFFMGAEFTVNKENIVQIGAPVISTWDNSLHGLEAIFNFWNLCLGFAVFFLARTLGCLYFINNITVQEIRDNTKKQLLINAVAFLVFFLTYLVKLLLSQGWTEDSATGLFSPENYKYLNNLLQMPWALVILLIGVVLVLYGIIMTVFKPGFIKGIWFSGTGTVFTVLVLLLIAGFNHTAYYPSVSNPQSSLSITNSSSSFFTLQVMSIVSLVIPLVLAYIWYAWRSLTNKKIESLKDLQGHDY